MKPESHGLSVAGEETVKRVWERGSAAEGNVLVNYFAYFLT
jgi:hypothetical protein